MQYVTTEKQFLEGSMTEVSNSTNPERIWQLITGYQVTAAIKAAIEIGVFTKIAEGDTSAKDIADSTGASERGIRILCDTMTVLGLLSKADNEYSLADDAALFLDERSPAYMGRVIDFMIGPTITRGFSDLTAAVKQGGTTVKGDGSVDPESPMWATFARSMTSFMVPSAQKMASELGYERERPLKVLDIAAGHGMFGITVAQQYPNAEIHAVDWKIVLPVARENAEKYGIAERYHTIEGNAFDVELGSGYDVVLITNFLHHFDVPTCEAFLRRVNSVMENDGQALTLEFVPNDDRVSPPGEALFPIVMLATTPSGDAYTFKELKSMFENAGFLRNEHRPMPGMPQHWIASGK
jgi:ubiquinone/menaquinone biosynthesis C-methylase UbiE